jgi:general secretion pathway protein D
MLDQVKKIIALLDVTSGDKGVIHVYYCKNARARELAGILAGLGGGVGGGFQQSTTRTTQPSITSPYGGTSTYGGMSNYSGMSGMSGMSGASGISGFGGLTTGSRSATASGPASATLTGGLFEGEIKISADDMVNSLLIVASPRDYDTLRAVIEKLDIPRRQVFVEAVLLEVTLTQTRSMSTSLHAANALSNNGAIIGSSAPGSLNSLTLLSQLASAGTSIPGGMTLAAFGQQFTVPGTDGKLVVPSAGYILNMLASDNNVNVLSTPTILTTDNQDAEIQVGEEIPIPTGQSIATGGISSVSITRETVGIKLKITPQICESGTIRMDIAVETSNAVPSSLGVNVNTLGVTTTLKTASTTVIVKDTQTIVIGGLMQDTRSADNSRFPLIGDIPVLGWLFKSADKSKTKNNLIILITPHVVHSDEEVERMRQKFKGQYDSFVEESLNREGKSWDEYFSTKYSGTFAKQTPKTEETIDLTGPKPKIINENPPQGDAKPKTESGEFSVHEGIEQGSTVNPLESSTVLSPEKAVNPNQDQNVQPAQPAKKKHWYDRNPKANSSDTGAQPPQ